MATISRLFQPVTETLEQVVEKLKVELVMITRNTPTYLQIEATGGLAAKFYKVGMQQRKGSVFEEQPQLYCEHLLSYRTIPYLFVRDSRVDPIWNGNEDQVVFGLINYLGYPIRNAQGSIFGTVCVLHNQPRDYSDEEKAILKQLQQEAEDVLKSKTSQVKTYVSTTEFNKFQPLPTPLTPLKVEAILTARKS